MKMSRSSQIIHALLGAFIFCCFVHLDCADHHEHDQSQEIVPQVLARESGEGSLVKLRCMSRLQEPLFFAKWFKTVDGQEKEIYRFERTANPQKQLLETVPGVKVDVLESDDDDLALYDLNSTTNGLYVCVHSLRAPSSNSVPMRSSFQLSVDESAHPIIVTQLVAAATSSVPLECHVDQRSDQTYGYKWYKDGVEFYHNIPWNTQEPEEVHPLPNVKVDLEHSTGRHIKLDDFTAQSSGQYKCVASLNVPNTRSLVYKITVQLD